MADEDKPKFGSLLPDVAAVAFSGPAVMVDQIAVTEKDQIVRISTMESVTPDKLEFRGAVVMTLEMAEQLEGMLHQIISKAKGE